MDLYLKNQAQKAQRAKKRNQRLLDKQDSVSYLRKKVSMADNPALERRLHKLEVRASDKKRHSSTLTKSRKLFFAQEKNRLQAEHATEDSNHLMYDLLPGKYSEVKQLAPRTFLYEDVLYRLKRNRDTFRVYANAVGNNSKIVVHGSIANLESVVKELKGVHRQLSSYPIIQTSNDPTYFLGTGNLRVLKKVVPSTNQTEEQPEKKRKGKKRIISVQAIDEHLVPVYRDLDSVLETMGVAPMVVGFQVVDSYDNPVASRPGIYAFPKFSDEDQADIDTDVLSTRRPSRYLVLAAGVVLAIFNTLTGVVQDMDNPQVLTSSENETPAAAVFLNDRGSEPYTIDPYNGGSHSEMNGLPGSEGNIIYCISNSELEGVGAFEELEMRLEK